MCGDLCRIRLMTLLVTIMEIHTKVVDLLSQPELAFITARQREDLVAVVTMAMIDLAKECDPKLEFNMCEMINNVRQQYYERLGCSASEQSTKH
jgi:hypothetical protein